MATITSMGVGSGLDLESLVTKLMSVEQTPLTAIQKKQASVNTRISSLGTLKSKLADLQTAAKSLKANIGKTALETFATYSASSSDSTVGSATVGTGAVAGNYLLNVTKLAQAQRFVSTAYQAAGNVAASDVPIGSVGDTLTFEFGTPVDGARTKTLTLDSTSNSLAGLRNLINGANMGVTATIVNGTAGSQLILSGQEGLANEITLSSSVPAINGLASKLTQTISAQDAEFTLNSIAATSSTNSDSKALDGVTLSLSKIGSTTLSISSNYAEKLTANLNSFITAYNAANSTMKSMGAYNATTKVAGALQGNNILRDAQSQTRNLLASTTMGGSSAYQRLSDIGVSVGTDGSLSLDAAKLSKALAADPAAAAALVDKIGTNFNTTIEKFVSYSGSIKIATDSTTSILKDLSSRSDSIQRRLVTIEARYRKQFTALDSLISGLNSTSSYLTQQLASLSSSSSSK